MAVVDASIVAAAVLPDEASDFAVAALRATRGHNAVPPVFRYEMVNLMLTAWRRGRLDESYARFALGEVEALRLQVSTEGQEPSRLHELGVTHRITSYDAAYLSLAIVTGEPLATLDQRLRTVAEQIGVEVL